MKKMFLVVLLIVGLLIPAVSAETIIDEELTFFEFTGGTYQSAFVSGSYPDRVIDEIKFENIENHPELTYIAFTVSSGVVSNVPADGLYEFNYTGLGETKTGRFLVESSRNFLGVVTSYRYSIFFDDWDIGDLAGPQSIKLSRYLFHGQGATLGAAKNPVVNLGYSGGISNVFKGGYTISIASGKFFQNHLTVNDDLPNSYQINLQRVYDNKYYPSTINLKQNDTIVFSESSAGDFGVIYLKSDINNIEIIVGDKVYSYPLEGDISATPDAIPINIRVQNSQTGALLADAHINITASVDGEFHEVVNETIPAGTKTYYLQPTGGGLPNPDFYRLIATVEGYNPIMPYIDFEADIATTIYAYLNPIGGAPVDENKTFIDFYVRDLNANPVAGATVKFGAYTLLTNSAGYTIFEVDKDKLYVWTVSKAGYGSVTGNAVIGSDARYTINAVIAPAVTPTLTTPIPTSPTVKPTPTLTSPTGEPVSNLLEWAAAHFGMLLGGGLEIGKIFMWLCFTIPAGVYVGKQAKAGAAGFMAGAGIVTLFFVIIGWVPIWLVVILALVIGLLYAKAFSNIGNGGGR